MVQPADKDRYFRRSLSVPEPALRRTRPQLSSRRQRRGRGFSGVAALQPIEIPKPQILRRRLPTLELWGEEELRLVEARADRILAEVGVAFPDDAEARALLTKAGATVEGDLVMFEPGLARSLCRTAPKHFDMLARNPDRHLHFGDDAVVFMPSYGSPFVTCLDRGRRYATLEDFENLVKLAYMSPYLHHSGGTVCEPVDRPVNKRHLDMLYAHLRYSDKPFMGSVTAPERAEDSLAMARIAFGDATFEQNCVIQGNINVNSPLVYDAIMTGALKAYARAGQCPVISPFILAGAMSPVTQVAALAQALAELLAGIALTQVIRPGCPVIAGSFLTTMNLKTGAPTFGTPEAHLSSLAFGQLIRRLGLPLRTGGHLTASKCADAQAMQESATSMMSGLMAGSNFVFHAAGWLEGGLTVGYEKFMLDLDHCGMMHRFSEGLVVDDESLALDTYTEAPPGHNHLGTSHTLRNFRSANHESSLADVQPYETWVEQGSQSAEQRANIQWKQALQDYSPPYIEPGIDEALRAFMDRRKASMPDAWY